MKITFLKDFHKGRLQKKTNDILELGQEDTLSTLNEKYYMLIFHGLRYDVLKDDVEIIEI